MPAWLLDFIRPPDEATPLQMKRWHWNVALTMLACTMFMGWSVTPYGFALADDVDKKVAEAIRPIERSVDEMKATVAKASADQATTQRLLVRKLASDLKGEIIEAKIRQCKAGSTDAAAYFRDQALEKQSQYTELTGDHFVPPTCADL